MDRVGVIIPTTHTRNSLASCLSHLSNQTRLPDAVYVVLEKSAPPFNPDNPSFSSLPLIVLRNKGYGPCEARNTGLAVCKQEIVAFLDDDSFADEHWVSECLKGCADKAFPAQLGRIVWSRASENLTWHDRFIPQLRQKIYDARHAFYGSEEIKEAFTPKDSPQMGLPESGYALHLSGGNCAIRMDYLWQIGFFNPQFTTYHDKELACRILSRGDTIVYNPNLIVAHDHSRSVRRWVKRSLFAMPYDKLLKEQYKADVWKNPMILMLLKEKGSINKLIRFSWSERAFIAILKLLTVFFVASGLTLRYNPLEENGYRCKR